MNERPARELERVQAQGQEKAPAARGLGRAPPLLHSKGLGSGRALAQPERAPGQEPPPAQVQGRAKPPGPARVPPRGASKSALAPWQEPGRRLPAASARSSEPEGPQSHMEWVKQQKGQPAGPALALQWSGPVPKPAPNWSLSPSADVVAAAAA
mmetsp:Transcript_50041/g.150561  ORF Transcript_50041/g.150561 Transcript_50041/m.150561 type:complete len:154 (-) Transcript_50041:3211-3672(-)